MNRSTSDPDYADTAPSAYDPEPDLGERPDEISWKPPVVAAIAGALTVAVFTIYAIVTGPGVDDVSSDEVSQGLTSSAQLPAEDLSPGLVLITEDVGARVESVTGVPSATLVFVSTSVPGSVDAATVAPGDVAFWELVTPAGTFAMLDQIGLTDPTGSGLRTQTISFPADVASPSSELLAYVVDTSIDESVTIELPSDLPAEITDVRIDLEAGPVVVVDSLRITDDGGYIEWRVEGGFTARVEVRLRFAGTSGSGLDGTTLVPEYARDFQRYASISGDPPQELYTFGSRYRLVRLGTPLDTENLPTGLSVELRVTAVTSVADPVSLPIGNGS